MTTTATVFLSSLSFGAVLAVLYFFTTREVVGTLLLGIFAAGFAFVFSYLWVTRRRVPLDGDGTLQPADLAGERIGIYSVESPWPILLAFSCAGALIGVVLHPLLALFSGIAILSLIWRMVVESV